MRIDVGNLPVWGGVKDEPGFTTLPFTLEVDQGLIRLAASSSEVEGITTSYGKDTYSFITSPPGTSEWGTRLGDGYVAMLERQVGILAGKSVLEIGSGTLYIAEKVVKDLYADRFVACDPVLRTRSELSAVEVVPEYFSSESFAGERFDAVLSINNLEHIPEPLEHLRAIVGLLKSTGGFLYLVLPDSSRGLETGDLGICIHEHLFYYTPETLTAVLKASGLALEWLYTQDDTLYAIARPGAALPLPTSTAEASNALLETFETKFRRNLVEAEHLITTQLASAPPLGIHGCNAGLNNTLALLKIDAGLDLFLFDGDSIKFGKYLPAFNRPILSSEDDSYRAMQTVVVAATTYYDEISAFITNTHAIPARRIFPIFPVASQPDS